MRHHLQPLIAVTALLFAATIGMGLPATTTAAQAAAPSAARAGMPFDHAVADAVRGSFDAGTVEVELSRVDVVAADASQRELLAHGRISVAGSGWVPLEVAALYDVATATATTQRLALGDAETRPATAAGALAARLSEEASRRLRTEFPDQPASLRLAGVEARQLGNGLVALEAVGRADFADEGVAAASVQALYDTAGDRWLRLQYRLGSDGMTEPVAGL